MEQFSAEQRGRCFSLEVTHRIAVSVASVTAAVPCEGQCLLWCQIVPDARFLAADGVFRAPAIFVLGRVSGRAAQLHWQRWVIDAASALRLALFPESTSSQDVQTCFFSGVFDAAVRAHFVVTGLQVGPPHETPPEGLRPLLVRRYLAPPDGGPPREAVAASVPPGAVVWADDGALGPGDATRHGGGWLTPALAGRPARVRRHPRRCADVVGVVPHGVPVRSLGRCRDAATGDDYALLQLPRALRGEQAAALADGALQCFADGARGETAHVWGWARLAGASGPFLRECASPESPDGADGRDGAGCCESRRPLPAPTYFTPCSGRRAVPVTKEPAAGSARVGTVHGNEVREAVALVGVGGGAGGPLVWHAEWKTGGYSLVASASKTFLRELVLERADTPPLTGLAPCVQPL